MVLGFAAVLILAAPGFVEPPSGVNERAVQRAIQRFMERSAGGSAARRSAYLPVFSKRWFASGEGIVSSGKLV